MEANCLGVHLAATMFFVIVKGKDFASRCIGLICSGSLLEKEGIFEERCQVYLLRGIGREFLLRWKVERAAAFEKAMVHGEAELVADGRLVDVSERDIFLVVIFGDFDYFVVSSSAGVQQRRY